MMGTEIPVVYGKPPCDIERLDISDDETTFAQCVTDSDNEE